MARLRDKGEEARILKEMFNPATPSFGRITSIESPSGWRRSPAGTRTYPRLNTAEDARTLQKLFGPDARGYGEITCAEAPGRPATSKRREPPTPEPRGPFRWWRRKPRA